MHQLRWTRPFSFQNYVSEFFATYFIKQILWRLQNPRRICLGLLEARGERNGCFEVIEEPLHKGGKSLSSQCPSFCPRSHVHRLFKQVKCVAAAWRRCVSVCGAPMHPMRLDHLCAMCPAVTPPLSLLGHVGL